MRQHAKHKHCFSGLHIFGSHDHGHQGVWLIATTKTLKIFSSETGGQNLKKIGRSDRWITFNKNSENKFNLSINMVARGHGQFALCTYVGNFKHLTSVKPVVRIEIDLAEMVIR